MIIKCCTGKYSLKVLQLEHFQDGGLNREKTNKQQAQGILGITRSKTIRGEGFAGR